MPEGINIRLEDAEECISNLEVMIFKLTSHAPYVMHQGQIIIYVVFLPKTQKL